MDRCKGPEMELKNMEWSSPKQALILCPNHYYTAAAAATAVISLACCCLCVLCCACDLLTALLCSGCS
uniref:Uncharacterized protein n=1 Tax=Setaria italica TaxID=4555 RepID=K3Y0N6_SETIT